MEKLLLLFCNWSTLGVCAALKLPQISAVLAARSARGISLPSLLLELAGFLVFLRYQCYYEYPLLTYLEYPILIAQDVLLLLQNLSTFISVASKFAQLQYLWKTRDSGTVSALTWSLAAYTCATKNNNNDNDHRRSYDSYTFRDHACFKRVGNHHGPSLQEDGGKG
ncbi:solute carrier family 66 member 3 isoform X2 [Prionailurus iriomotensis]